MPHKTKLFLTGIFFSIFLLVVILFLFLSYQKIDFKKTSERISKNLLAMAQEEELEGLIFATLPRYPQRLMYIAGEIESTSEELSYLNKRLKDLTDQCDCQFTQSYCIGTPTGMNLFDKLTSPIKQALFSQINTGIANILSMVNQQANSLITKSVQEVAKVQSQYLKDLANIQSTLNSISSQAGKKSVFETNKELNQVNYLINNLELQTRGMLDNIRTSVFQDLKKTESSVKKQIMEVKDNAMEKTRTEIEKIKPAPTSLEIRETEEKLTFLINSVFQENKEELNDNSLSQTKSNKALGALGAEEIQQLQSKINELNSKAANIQSTIDSATNKIQSTVQSFKNDLENKLGLFGELLKTMDPCKPSPIGVLGEPCPDEEEIEEVQAEIAENIEQIIFLRNLLIKEMGTGLQKEIESLRPEYASQLTEQVEKILDYSSSIVYLAQDNNQLPEKCTSNKCGNVCPLSFITAIKACLMIGSGEQKPGELKFSVEVNVEDIKLGQIGIKGINLALPDKIESGQLGDMVITIPAQTVSLAMGEQRTSIDLQPSFNLPQLPQLNFSCPYFPQKSYQCAPAKQLTEEEAIEQEWFYQTFNYLSENCQKLPSMTLYPSSNVNFTQEMTEKIKSCFDPEKLPSIIVKECSQFICVPNEWSTAPYPPPPICGEISCGNVDDAALVQCENLAKEINEPIPSSCAPFLDPGNEWRPAVKNPDFAPLETLKNKCQELKTKKVKNAPTACKILPLLTGKMEYPKSLLISTGGGECPSQNIFDYPNPLPGCGFSLPSLPKISLPDIIIPDIHLPHFTVWPFLEVKLPNIIFEDLDLPDIDLCNLDDCSFVMPTLTFKPPVLSLPSIKTSLPLPNLNMDLNLKIDFPSLPFFGLPSLPLASLITPEISLPTIALPTPNITFNFSGIDLSAIFDYITTFLLNALGIPDYSVCINYSLEIAPIRIIFPDYYFSWPAIPQVPPIPYCEDVVNFCKEVKEKLKEVTNKVDQIQKQINQAVQVNIQEKLNKIAQKAETEINQQINQVFEEYKQEINAALQSGAKYLTLKEKKIPIPLSKYAKEEGILTEIPINWPAELKKINLSKGITYDLPTIKLSKLKYKKEYSQKIPGFQKRTISADIGIGGFGECEGGTPTGGNPCPTNEINVNVYNIQALESLIKESSQKIANIIY